MVTPKPGGSLHVLSRALRIAAVAVAIASPLRAQVVMGSVVLPDSTTPVAGAIVTASDALGTTVARALTSRRGEFVLRLPAAGAYRLGVLRIGYRPTPGPEVSVAEQGTERVRMVAAANPVILAALGVRERETCRVSADTGLMVAQLWEEARKAMLTSQLSAEGAPMFAEWIEYDRTLDSTSRIVRQQRVRTTRSRTTHAFRSVPAEILREKGFVVADDIGTNYYAPDAEVLLSDDFVAGHCFQLLGSPRDSAHLAGVGFVPSSDRRNMKEIEGTLWIDKTSAELRRLEFRYLNLHDAAEPAKPGGVVEFRRLMDGNWFVNRWSVRMPRLEARSRVLDNRRTLMTASGAVLRAVQVTGGEVTRAVRADSVLYQATGPGITLQIVSRDSLVSAAGATLALDGTDYLATADATGRIRLSPVLAGRYRASIRTPVMELLGMPPIAREVEATLAVRTDSLVLPSARDALGSACPRDSLQEGEGLLHGRVRDERARPIGGAVVTATWAAAFSVIGMRDGGHLQYSERTLRARSDAAGRWRMCGVPRASVLTVTAASDSGFDRQRARLNDQPMASVDLVVRRVTAGVNEMDIGKPPGLRALVEIAVTDDRGAHLPDAVIEVESRGAATRTVVTGQNGVALVPDVPHGPIVVRAKRIGFMPGQVPFTVEADRVTVPLVMSAAVVPTLDAMRVVGARPVPTRLDAFERRMRLRQATASITRDEIVKRNPVDTWQLLTNTASVRVTTRENKVVATTGRTLVARFDQEPCFMRIMVDGLLLNPGDEHLDYDLRQLPHPDQIHGIEIFAGPATIPVEYGGTGPNKWCGLIAIWTR